jgi:hypothetical protein
MKHRLRSNIVATSAVLPVVTAALAIGIFVLDTVTSLEIAVAVLYVRILDRGQDAGVPSARDPA